MERTLRRLLRVYPVTRNWIVLPNYVMPSQFLQNTSQVYCTNITDNIQWKDTKIPIERYRFYDNKITQDPMKMLKMVTTNYINMSLNDAIGLMSALFKTSKYFNNDIEKIRDHVGFIHLCEVLNKDVRLMKISEVIESLKVLVHFKVSANTFICQSLLQMIRTTINEISLRDIIFIYFLLNKLENTPLGDALLIALPLVFEIQLPIKLDSSDIILLSSSLRFATRQNIKNPEIYNIIFKSLLNHEDLDVHSACSIFCSLCHMRYFSLISLQLFSNVQNVLTNKAKELSTHDIISIFEKLQFAVTKSKKQRYQYYNETMVDALVNSALFFNINFPDGVYLLKLLNDLNHAHIPFLEYLAAKCFQQPSLLKKAPYFKVFTFLEGFTNADYKPLFWDTIRDAILENQLDDKSIDKSLSRFVLYLTALDCYSPSLLSRVFSSSIKSEYESIKHRQAREILLLYQSVKTLYPMYDGPWPSQEIIEYAMLQPMIPAYSFKPALEQALGGSQYVCNNLRTKLGHFIDHVVVMRKGGYPIAINTDISSTSNTIYVEDIQTPSESQIILIFNIPNRAYAVNSQRLKSTWSLKMKSAEALIKCDTIGINSSFWMKLPEHERVPYLMQAIKLKCEDLSLSMN